MKSIYKKIGATVVSAIASVNVMALDELNVAYFENSLKSKVARGEHGEKPPPLAVGPKRPISFGFSHYRLW